MSLPYITASGNIKKALTAIISAAIPELISQDFVKRFLKIPGGSGNQMTSFLKKINFADESGRPTALYRNFRDPSTSKKTLAKAIKHAYEPLYKRNESMHDLPDKELTILIRDETGQAHDSNPVKMIFACIKALISEADFSQQNEETAQPPAIPPALADDENNNNLKDKGNLPIKRDSLKFNIGYTINLNLPATPDSEVYNAIFKSLKQHLLCEQDA